MESFPWDSLFVYLENVAATTVLHIALSIGVGVILGVFINFLSRTIRKYAGSIFPQWLYAYLMSPGAVLHELAHWFFLWILGYQITEVKLFQYKRDDPRSGYVKYGTSESYFQRVGEFFASVGPIVVGSLVIYILSVQLSGTGMFEGVPLAVAMGNASDLLGALEQLGENILLNTEQIFSRLVAARVIPGKQLALFVYLAFTIVNGMDLSAADLKLARPGFLLMVNGIFLINLLTLWTGVDLIGSFFVLISRPLSGFYAIMAFVACLDVVLVLIVVPLGMILGSRRRR